MKSIACAGLFATLAASLVALAPGCGGSDSDGGFIDGNGSGSDSGGGTGSGGDGGGGFGGGGGGSSDSGGGGGALDAACATATAAAAKQPVYMLMVLDGSLSMNEENKWKSVVPALDSIFDNIQASNDTSFGVGLIGFSDSNDSTKGKGPYPGTKDISIAYVDATQDTALHGRIDKANPANTTPTKAALTGAYAELEAFTPSGMLQTGGKKVVVLMTDGVPSDSTTAQDSALAAAELAKTGPQGPITTFVVGVGDFSGGGDYDPTFLGQVAQAGGAAPAGCNPTEKNDVTKVCFFEIDPSKAATPAALTAAFVAAINTIRGELASCTFTLSKTSMIDPTKVNVVYTSGTGMTTVVGEDGTNGWTYDNPADPTTVTLHGTSCDAIKGDPKGSITISIGCPTVVTGPH